MPGVEDTRKSTRVGQEAEGARGPVGFSLYCGFCRKEWARWGEQA